MAKNIGDILLSNGLPKRKARINLGGTNITSMDFGRFKILHSSLLMPKDKINASFAHNIRLSGMVAPTIGACDLTLKSFFVPCRVAWEGFQPFINKLPWYQSSGAVTPSLPTVTNGDLASLFTTFCGFRDNQTVLDHGVLYNPDFDTPAFRTPYGLKETQTMINSRYVDNPLTEIIGVCDGIGTDGSLTDFKTIDSIVACGAQYDEYIPRFKDRYASYTGKDYDFVGLPTGLHNGITQSTIPTGQTHYMQFPWMHTPTQQEIEDNPSCATGTNPWGSQYTTGTYLVYRFTTIGKQIYDFLINLGYSINFVHAHLNYSVVDSRSSSGDTYWSQRYQAFTAFSDTCKFTMNPSTGYTKFTTSQCKSGDDSNMITSGITKKYHGAVYNQQSNNDHDDTKFNMLPIFSYMRIYIDHLCPMQWYNTWATYYETYLHRNGFQANVYYLSKLYDAIICTYDKDYFTTAWGTPNSPTGLTTDQFGFDAANSTLTFDSSGHAPYQSDVAEEKIDTTNGLTGLGLRALNALTKWRRLNNVSGSRAVDRMLVRFGIRPSDERVNRAELIGGSKSQFDISLVMSQAQTDGANLGDYVAHGESRNGGDLGSYEASEWGYFIIVAWITPKAKYYQGRVRQNMYTTQESFLTPEFDEVDAMQAIRQDELYADCRRFDEVRTGKTYSLYSPSGTFGYTRMWGEMKVGRDILSGDFRLASRGKYSNNSFHLFRELPDIYTRRFLGKPLVNGNDFNICNDASQYDRIFQYDGDDYDHFFCYFKIDVDCTRNTKAITDYTLNDENDDTRLVKSEMFGHQVK